MKVGDLVKSNVCIAGQMKQRRTHGIVIRTPTPSEWALVFWPGEKPVWEWRRWLVLLQEPA